MSENESSVSLVHYLGTRKREDCGYCRNGTMSSHALWAVLLEASDYQDMLDRGWRRSGKYCYKPINRIACCPSYTISCDALNFKPDKSQRRCIRNMNNFLRYGIIPNVSHRNTCLNDIESEGSGSNSVTIHKDNREILSGYTKDHRCNKKDSLNHLTNAKVPKTLEYLVNSSKMKSKRLLRRIYRVAEIKKYSNEEAYNFILNKCTRRRERFLQKSLEDHLFSERVQEKVCHTLELRIHSVTSDECHASRDDELNLLQKYQTSVHKDDEDSWTMKRYKAFLITSPIIRAKITALQPDVFQNQSVESTCLVNRPQLPSKYGTYHCQYWLDNTKLIAVGVLDVLTSCISSVYLYYDPEYSFLNLGVYSALHEISMVRCMHAVHSSITKYYMGFYIHTCPKMAYKIKYQPSSILCPETNIFIDSKRCLEKLHLSKYARFSPDTEESDYRRPTFAELSGITILDGGSLITLGKFMKLLDKSNISADRVMEAILDYSQLVGCHLSDRMILGSHTLRQQYLTDN